MEKEKKKKIGTKMVREMEVGQQQTVCGLTYKEVKSAQSICWQVEKSYGVKTQVKYSQCQKTDIWAAPSSSYG